MTPSPIPCPDCGLLNAPARDGAPVVCPACLAAATPQPEDGWPIVATWVGPGRGRGVFTRRAVLRGELVERCWVMPLPPGETESSLTMPVLNRYLFPWADHQRAIISGAGLLYNFDRATVTGRNPNVGCVLRLGLSAVEFWALRDLLSGEECTWDYQKATLRSRP